MSPNLRSSLRTLLDSTRPPAHPKSDYSIVRFKLDLPNGQTGAGEQPMELCFHSNFNTSPLRPIAMHFDQSNIISHTQSSEEDAATIVDLGLVNVSPDDPQFMELLEQQTKRELSERQERHMAEARGPPRLALSRLAQLWPLFLAGAVFCIYLPLQPKPPLATPISPEFPLLPRISAFALAATNLAPTICFNQLLHIGISDKPGAEFTLPPNSYSTLEETYKTSRDLYHYVNTRILDEGVHATVMYRDMAFCGRRRDDTEELFYKTWDTASDVRSHFSMSNYDLVSRWSGSIATNLRWPTRYLENKSLVPADDMFIAQGNMSRWVLRESLPPKMPPGVTLILQEYTFWVTHYRGHHFSSVCEILHNCSSTVTSPEFQHPSCSRHDSLEDTMQYLRTWAEDARRQNRSMEDVLGSIKWHGVLDLPRTIAQLIDLLEQLIQAAEFMKLMPVITTISWQDYYKERRSSLYDITNLWPKKYETEDPTDKIARAKELLNTRLLRLLRDVSQGLRLMHNVCDDFNGLTDFIDSLFLPTNWIINEEGPFVELLQMPQPTEQVTYLSGLNDELFRRLKKTDEFHSLREWWDEQEKEKWDKQKKEEWESDS